MKTWVRRSLNAGALAAGALLAAGAPAHADVTAVSADNSGILNGTQILLPVQLPVNVCGNAIALLGDAYAACGGGATASLDAAAVNEEWSAAHYREAHSHGQATLDSHGNAGVLNGTQVYAPIQVPLNVCGNAIGVLGNAHASCDGGATATQGAGKAKHGKHYGEAARIESDMEAPHTQPQRTKPGYPKVKPPARSHGQGKHGTRDSGPALDSHGNAGILNGTQVYAPIQAPINVCGNAVAVLGNAYAACAGGATAAL
ncbi:MAG TPA: chaplin family protein [Micromonosporaceae bacterium]|jgi:hypothetical protein|nr:chaplin family protein [Micromonosporaceae bacterium]